VTSSSYTTAPAPESCCRYGAKIISPSTTETRRPRCGGSSRLWDDRRVHEARGAGTVADAPTYPCCCGVLCLPLPGRSLAHAGLGAPCRRPGPRPRARPATGAGADRARVTVGVRIGPASRGQPATASNSCLPCPGCETFHGNTGSACSCHVFELLAHHSTVRGRAWKTVPLVESRHPCRVASGKGLSL
jgi:hypothetical protein